METAGSIDFYGNTPTRMASIQAGSPFLASTTGRLKFYIENSSSLYNYMTLDATGATSPYVLTAGGAKWDGQRLAGHI